MKYVYEMFEITSQIHIYLLEEITKAGQLRFMLINIIFPNKRHDSLFLFFFPHQYS